MEELRTSYIASYLGQNVHSPHAMDFFLANSIDYYPERTAYYALLSYGLNYIAGKCRTGHNYILRRVRGVDVIARDMCG